MTTFSNLKEYSKIIINDISLNGDLSSNTVGPIGPKGEKGEIGLKGSKGAIGITGPVGPVGLALSIWQTGSNGNDIYFNNKTDGINTDKDVLISDRSSTYNSSTANRQFVIDSQVASTKVVIGNSGTYAFIEVRNPKYQGANTGYTPYVQLRANSFRPYLHWYTISNLGNYSMYHWWDNWGATIRFLYVSGWKGWIRHYSQTAGSRLNFTGQHRTFIKDIHASSIDSYKGLIVCSNNNTYIDMKTKIPKYGKEAISINDSLPLVSLTKQEKDTTVFGVISDCEELDNEGHRLQVFGHFVSASEKEYGDERIHINSVGEGAIWVSNKNGSLVSGEYITSSNIPGYGQKQDSEFVYNYTVAKITMDCDFQPKLQYKKKIITRDVEFTSMDSSGNYYDVSGNIYIYNKDLHINNNPNPIPRNSDYNIVLDDSLYLVSVTQNILDSNNELQWEDTEEQEYQYDLRYIDVSGNILSKEQYEESILNNENVYMAAFVGCTYHCG